MKKRLLLVPLLLSVHLLSACALGVKESPSPVLPNEPEVEATVNPSAPPLVPSSPPTETSNASPLLLTFAGDTMMAGRVGDIIKQKGADYPLKDAASIFNQSDLTMLNVETAISNRGTAKNNKEYTFQSDPSMAEALNQAGVDVVTVANNHALDFGVEAFTDTMKNLNTAGLKYVGGGINQEEAYAPARLEIKDKKISFFGFSRVLAEASWHAGLNHPGMASAYDPDLVYKVVKPEINTSEYTVVYIHWGEELSEAPLPYQVQLAHGLIDQGVDLVIGSHPHVLQGFEWYKGKFIAYSLGNFVFTTSRVEEGRQSGILEVTLSGEKIVPRFIPMYINQGAVWLADKNQSQKIMDRLKRLSKGGTWTQDGSFEQGE